MGKCTVCKECGVTRTEENWRPSGTLCAKCFYELHGKTAKHNTNAKIKMLANEIVINYRRKTYTGVLCACRDLVKYYDKNKIMCKEEEE